MGGDPVPRIRVSNFIAPRGLDLTHPGYLIMDGIYYTYLHVRKNGFPQTVRGGWMSSLINAGEGIDVDLHLRSTMPFLYMDSSLERKSKRNVLTSGAASTYMFTSFELSDDNGILLGLNRHNNSLCIVDPFNTKVNKNANFTICGTSGAGKTYTMQVMALHMRMRGIQCFILLSGCHWWSSVFWKHGTHPEESSCGGITGRLPVC